MLAYENYNPQDFEDKHSTCTAIESIMGNFQFDRVEKAMVALGWTWVGQGKGVPSEGDLRDMAISLLRRVVAEGMPSCIRTGGFEARFTNGRLSLSFIIDDWTFDTGLGQPTI